jgi:DNA-binding transcriptional MerR regulator
MNEVTITSAAKKFKVPYPTLWNWVNQGHIPSVRRRWGKYKINQHMIKEEDLDVFLSMKALKKHVEPLLEETSEPEHPKSEFGKQMFQRMEKLEETILILSGQQAEMINLLKNLSSRVASDVTLNSGLNGLESKINEWLLENYSSENELHYEKRISEMEGRETVLDRIIKDLLQKNPNLWK